MRLSPIKTHGNWQFCRELLPKHDFYHAIGYPFHKPSFVGVRDKSCGESFGFLLEKAGSTQNESTPLVSS